MSIPVSPRALQGRIVFAVLLVAVMAIPASPAASPSSSAVMNPAPEPIPQAPRSSPATPRVTGVVSDVPGHPDAAGLGDRITVTVENLDSALAEAEGCMGLVLFLGGLAIPGTPPERCDPDDGHVGFLLARAEEADPAWTALLGKPGRFEKAVRLTIGSSKTRSYPTTVVPGQETFRLIILAPIERLLFLVTLVGSLVGVTVLSRRTALLRKPGAGEPRRRPYSLARFQLAFWSVLVVEAYFFVWLISGDLDTITSSVLALMGIGSGTALGSSLIDADPKAEAPPSLPPSRGFLTDLLSDPSGISIQRFQIFSWTLILGVIFCASVYKTLEMPEFSATLLGLMGISSGTYLAFKFPEKQTAAQSRPGA